MTIRESDDDPIFVPAPEVQDRPTWRARKPRNINRSSATTPTETENLSDAELRKQALGTAVAIMKDTEAMATARVGAIKVVLEATSPKPREFVLQMLDGDKEAYARWLRAELAEIDANDALLHARQ